MLEQPGVELTKAVPDGLPALDVRRALSAVAPLLVGAGRVAGVAGGAVLVDQITADLLRVGSSHDVTLVLALSLVKTTGDKSRALDWEFDWSDPDDVTVTARVEVDDGWAAVVTLRRPGRRLVVSRVEFEPESDDVALLFGDVPIFRRLGLKWLLREVQRGIQHPVFVHALPRGWVDMFEEVPRPGRSKRSDYDYAIWCERLEEADEEDSRAPVKLLSERYYVPVATLDAIFHKARRRGLLDGRTMTVKCRQILAGQDEEG